MNRRKTFQFLALLMVLLGASGCDNTTFSSGVEPEKEVDALTPEEQQLYCDSLSEFVTGAAMTDMVREMVCRTMGIAALTGDMMSGEGIFGGDPATCEDVYEQCMTSTDLEGFEAPEFPCNEADWESCNITVGELEACISEMTAWLDELGGFLSCDLMEMASNATAMTSIEGVDQLQACMTVATGCAGFMPEVQTDLEASSP